MNPSLFNKHALFYNKENDVILCTSPLIRDEIVNLPLDTSTTKFNPWSMVII